MAHMKFFTFLRALWRYLLAAGIIYIIAIMSMFFENWFKMPLSTWLTISKILKTISSVIVLIGLAKVMPKFYPIRTKTLTEMYIFLIVITVVSSLLTILVASLFIGTITYEKEFAQGLLTVSTVLFAFVGVILGINRFSEYKQPDEKALTTIFKIILGCSLLAGLVTMLFLLAWYAKADESLLQWSIFSFNVQLWVIITFLFFPKYYLK